MSNEYDPAHAEEQLSRGAREAEAPEELPCGALIAGKYRIRGVLGRGAFAVVYDAEHLALGRVVALKVLHRTAEMPHLLLQRFAREVRISALVKHPHVLEVYDAGTLDDGSPFLTLEKIAGLSLFEELCLARTLDIGEAIELGVQLLSALVELASHGIVHRDIKPENLMLTRSIDGQLELKLVDFGVALMRDEPVDLRLTQHGALVGTPHYMAPEQLRCEWIDPRVDLYATGVVLYQVLTGKLPYDGADLSSLTLNVLFGDAPPVRQLRPDCPPALARVIERALSRAPERRYQTAQSMLRDLARCRTARRVRSASSVSSASTVFRVRHQLSRQARRPRTFGLAAALLAATLVGAHQAPIVEAVRSAVVVDRSAEQVIRVASEPPSVRVTQLGSELPEQPLPYVQVLAAAPLEPHAPASEPSAEQTPQLPKGEVVRKSAASSRSQSQGGVEATPSSAAISEARTLSQRALRLYLRGELDAAYAMYREASRLVPHEPAAFRGLGLSAARLGRKHEARRAFARYLELAPDAHDAHLIRTRLSAIKSEGAAILVGAANSADASRSL